MNMKTKMRNTLLSGTALLLMFGMNACSPKYYVPDTQNVPLISEKGETNLNLSGNGNQYEFQGAYGITEGLAVKANGSLFAPSDEDNGDGGSGKYFEGGIGFFKPIQEHWVFETYGIFGIGSMENHFPSSKDNYPLTTGDISADVMRYGIQPNFGFESKYFSAAVSARFVNLTYNNIKGNLIFENEQQVDYLKDNSSNFLIEPAFTIRFGLENVKLQLQYGYSINTTNDNFRQDESTLSIGLNVNLK